jgi:hypothetical protein
MQPTDSRSPLSVHRAFVVQFRAEAESAHGGVAGRIEHVASRESALFHSWTDLKVFIERILVQVRSQPPEAP